MIRIIKYEFKNGSGPILTKLKGMIEPERFTCEDPATGAWKKSKRF